MPQDGSFRLPQGRNGTICSLKTTDVVFRTDMQQLGRRISLGPAMAIAQATKSRHFLPMVF